MRRKPGPVARPDASTGRLLAALAKFDAPVKTVDLAPIAGVPSKQVSRYLGPLIAAGQVKAYRHKLPYRYALVVRP